MSRLPGVSYCIPSTAQTRLKGGKARRLPYRREDHPRDGQAARLALVARMQAAARRAAEVTA